MNYQTDRPIYLQVIDDIRQKLIRGEITPGEKLPSVRELAQQYQINPNTASRVYKEMERSGICFTRRGMGTFITEEDTMMKQIKSEMAAECLDSFLQTMQMMGFRLEDMIQMLTERYEEGREDNS
ncbi:MAG: GntR family transcriptional regulator [Eubacteriales bacterium]|nr:GntR family transcriptional regulator [Eubacteriales bacterium]